MLLSAEAIAQHIPPGWQGGPDGLRRTYRYADFAEALAAVNRIGALAEERNHHPDIDIRWNRVDLVVVSHSAGGVTQADIDLARAISTVAG
jgi:4a-hydroxytetrahydrobiopterin dehydratase